MTRFADLADGGVQLAPLVEQAVAALPHPCLLAILPDGVPVAESLADILGLPTVWVPHSYAACSQHAPDEHLLAPVARQALELMAGLFWDLGDEAASLPRRTQR